MGLTDRLRRAVLPPETRAVHTPLTLDQYAELLAWPNLLTLNQTLGGKAEEIEGSYTGLVSGAYRSNGVVFACILTRVSIFSEARFQFRRVRGGKLGDLWGDSSLGILEHPWPNGTTGDLLTVALLDHDLAGNFFVTRRGDRLVRMRPDWVTIMIGSDADPDVVAGDLDATVIGYLYHPGGRYSGRDPVGLLPEQVGHFAAMRDPLAQYRGMAWLTPVIREVMGDQATTTHKLRFFENGATPNLLVRLSENVSPEKFRAWVEMFEQNHAGAANAYRTLYLGGGADATVIGTNLQQLDFKLTQGAGETRIAAAAGVHPTIVGLSEGLQGSSLNAGNFGAARRLVADRTARPLWRNFCGSVAHLVPTPPDSILWWDEDNISFLREDRRDAAEIIFTQAQTMRQLVDGGWAPDSVVAAVVSEDLTLLSHTGKLSVQLQEPGTTPAGGTI